MIKFSTLMLGTGNIKEMVDFYTKVLGKPDMDMGGGAFGWQNGEVWFTVMEHSEVKGESKEPARFIINFVMDNVKEEFDRIKAFGTKVIKEPYQMEGFDGWMCTLADTDGNYFQLTTPWKM